MLNHKIEALIFDLGNVLIDFDHRVAAKRICGYCDKTPQEIFDLFFDSDVVGMFEKGQIKAEDFFLKVKEMLGLNIAYDRFLPIWNEIFFLSENNRQVYALAKEVRKSYKTALLSNINVLHLDYLKRNFGVFDAFHHVIASCEVGLRKPDPKIYQYTLEALGVSSPSRVFYTDDRAELIEEGSRLNMRAFVFKDPRKLRQDLYGLGVELR